MMLVTVMLLITIIGTQTVRELYTGSLESKGERLRVQGAGREWRVSLNNNPRRTIRAGKQGQNGRP